LADITFLDLPFFSGMMIPEKRKSLAKTEGETRLFLGVFLFAGRSYPNSSIVYENALYVKH